MLQKSYPKMQEKEANAALKREEIEAMLVPGWVLAEDGKSIFKQFCFKNFAQALQFVNKLGESAEAIGHHPDLTLGWGYAGVTFTTHDTGGLSRNDFVMAAEAETHFQDQGY